MHKVNLQSNPNSHNRRIKSLLMRAGGVALAALFLLIGLAVLAGHVILEKGGHIGLAHSMSTATLEPRVLTPAPPQPQPEMRETVDAFARNQTFADALTRHGLSNREVYDLVESTRPVYNLARVASGRPYWVRLTAEGKFHDFRYPVDDERYLTVYREGDTYVPLMKKFAYQVRVEPVSGTIENSLFMAVKNSGEDEQLALDLAEIFMWDIDFYTDIQKGDSFRMLV